ncbi:hypothetical protein NIES2135_23260 [Leptolyngbya boryana NIES-2135]|uniref:Uncharacterized protein n=1 Tax=Leptolyngbya boryana NIES-2135 TaxID=1973484 RepID=A0A1Z4JFG6_LEPBY|nr:hypothetical protein NIES2135_23260 [Leptolyngbya boryana NIES-2135]
MNFLEGVAVIESSLVKEKSQIVISLSIGIHLTTKKAALIFSIAKTCPECWELSSKGLA